MHSYLWIALLILFCVFADFYVMREVVGQFGISNPNFGIMVGLMLLLIELTLAALAFNSSGENDKQHIINHIGKFVFLLFIPSMCFLSYYQNVENLSMGAKDLSLEIVKYKMIIISLFSLIIHFVLVINLEKGFSSYRYAVALSINSKMKKDIDVEYNILKKLIKQIQFDGAAYLRQLKRFNLLFPHSAKRVEYLPEGVISLINEGQREDVINLKKSQFTQVKPGYSRTDLIRLQSGKSTSDLRTEAAMEKIIEESYVDSETELPQSYESFFGNKESYI